MFDVAAESYGRFMGLYSEPLADAMLEVAVPPGTPVLDVGCGPGALTARLAARLGAGGVSAVDPSASFVAATAARLPGLDVRLAPAEDLPFEDGTFAAAYAALVVHFMTDPVAGLREMARVVRPGGLVAATVWDHGGGAGPLSAFWDVVAQLDPSAKDESGLAGSRQGQLVELAGAAGLADPVESYLTVVVGYSAFETWWEPYTLGVGPAGTYVAGLSESDRAGLRDACQAALPAGPFDISASAWTMVSRTR